MQKGLKAKSVEQAVKAIIHRLSWISDENLVRLTHFGEWLTDDPEVLSGIAKVRSLLNTPGHPAKAFFKRVLEYLPAKRRIRLFEALFNGAFFEGGNAGISGRRNWVSARRSS
ncbi:MAG: hypothetical protein U5R49_04525 [Deltaproteobacteria bacterium]|nr:hypothetical protein [Deltaproteobacteria bacterium]